MISAVLAVLVPFTLLFLLKWRRQLVHPPRKNPQPPRSLAGENGRGGAKDPARSLFPKKFAGVPHFGTPARRGSIYTMEPLFKCFSQRIPVIRMSNFYQRPGPLPQGTPPSDGRAVLRHDVVHIVAGGGHRRPSSSTGTILDIPLAVEGMAMMARPPRLMAAPRMKST